MKRAGKKILSVLLAVCLMLGVFAFTPTAAMAVQIATPLDFTASTGDDSGDGWAWDQSQKTLTLDGLDLLFDGSGSISYAIRLPGGSKIILIGSNRIEHSGGGRGIECIDGDLAIEGPGSVNITASGGETFAFGIYVQTSGGVTISGGAEVTITAQVAGIYTRSGGGVTVDSGAKLTANKGIDVDSDIIFDNATISVNGISSRNGSVTISGNTEATTGAIFAKNNVTISGDAEATTGRISAENNFEISGGEINTNGQVTADSNITISGGVVNITSDYEGLYAYGGIEISGGSGTIQVSDTSGDYFAVAAWLDGITVGSGILVKGWDGSDYTIAGVVGDYTDSWDDTFSTFLEAANPGVPLTNLQFETNVTFTAQNSINLQSPTNLVFKASQPGALAGYGFAYVQFARVSDPPTGYGITLDGSNGVTYDPATGILTIPAAVFGQHQGVSPLTAGTYRAKITFGDDAGGYFDYYADVTLTSGSNSRDSDSGSWSGPIILLDGLPPGNRMSVGGRFTAIPSVSPLIDGNWTWEYDENAFSGTFNSPATFTAKKAGVYTFAVKFSGGGYSLREEFTITVGTTNPSTGRPEGASPAALIALLCGIGFLLRKKRQGIKYQC